MMIQRLDSASPGFDSILATLLAWESVSDAGMQDVVKEIIEKVRRQGDGALIDYTARFDRLTATSMQALTLHPAQMRGAYETLPEDQREALTIAADRIRRYHEHQKVSSWSYQEVDGTRLGQQVTALDRVGIYVPGGKASYPSSVLMNAIPARVAGVKEVIMCVPTPGGETNPLVLAAAWLAGVDLVFTIGGAQAVAALAYGTESVPRVDKIVGPGNSYVATAKRQVFGQVGIDMIAGPSEILVYCDGKTSPDWIAMDLLSQAEHDELAQSILISEDSDFLDAVEEALHRLLPTLEREGIARTSLSGRGALIRVESRDAAVSLINQIAPEHLELSIDDPDELLPRIRHAGAIFMGRYTPEALGDYCAGPNHVLPTSGTARYSSPLGVYDFQKRSSLIFCSSSGASSLAKVASTLARGESLTAHARSAEFRIQSSAE